MSMTASEMGKLRWANTTREERSERMSALAKRRRKKLTKKQRSEIARNAVLARWKKAKNKKK